MKDRAYEIAINSKYDGYQRGLASMVYKLFDKKMGSGAINKTGVNLNVALAQELLKPLIKKFKSRKVYARFKNNICATDLAEMGSLFSKNWDVRYLLCVIDAFTKYVGVKPLKNKKQTVLNGFVGIVNESKPKPNKLWVDQEKEFYNNLMQKWLDDNDIVMHSTHNEGK